ncbi:hypothetical protein TTHERM_00442340 (macronuclear) [Tetrahymena thermophila SB210]|uniref:TRAF-type domain-containing protein n=1 Tax=Tetrahymena thermophila (strain SB210) TaxID=312017 RepID=I7MGU9_TETTS|nr:hypothetical protein TTHERM_00442340 [Tetrahymena thermophila SB210]EAR85484.1 hypothetical protein TTHERM_00442340 [Tetrahymena thermophila SB210]|eukprot:XP_001033147.1 hypothetical protein TTHERM_00442340 [Tetrahymena thermophila SB210]
MQDIRVVFDKLEGQSFESGSMILKAIFLNRQVMLKTNFKEIADLQLNLARQLGNIYTDRFQTIELEQLEVCGGILIDYFFEDALSYEFITHNDYFQQFFSKAQKIENQEEDQNVNAAVSKPVAIQQQIQKNNLLKEENNPDILEEEYAPQPIQTKLNDQMKMTQQSQKKGNQFYDIENNTFNEDEYIENEEIVIVNPKIKKKNNTNQAKLQNAQQNYGNFKGKKVQPTQNIYLNNRQLLEEKIHQDKKYIHSSKYFRSKIKQQLKFLYKIRKNLNGQTILNCFNCYKCHKNMYFGIRCFKCRREDMYFCEDCNTKCPMCQVLLKKTNDHVNIYNFYRLMSNSKITCNACIEDIPLIKYQEHLYLCEDNIENCKHCRMSLHYSQLQNHAQSECEQRPVICTVCNAKYPKYKQTSHKCIKTFYNIQKQLKNNFQSLKQQIDNQFNSLQDKLNQMQQIQNQPNRASSLFF